MPPQVSEGILEHLKRFQAGQDRTERDLKEIKSRLSSLESGQATVIQHIGNLSGAVAGQQVSIDHMSERIDRIKHRLALA